eukprot:8941597-Pyramimonas_sp.AAC.1
MSLCCGQVNRSGIWEFSCLFMIFTSMNSQIDCRLLGGHSPSSSMFYVLGRTRSGSACGCSTAS